MNILCFLATLANSFKFLLTKPDGLLGEFKNKIIFFDFNVFNFFSKIWAVGYLLFSLFVSSQ